MTFLPVGLNIKGKKILIVGGGAAALQKVRSLRRFTRSLTVVAKEVCVGIRRSGVPVREKPYAPSDLGGMFLVYACTDRKALNERIRRDAARRGVLANVVDNPRACDFISPAIYKRGRMAVAVSSDGTNVKKAIAWRDRIAVFLRARK